MNVLVIDRDRLSSQLVSSHLKGAGYSVVFEPSRNAASERLKEDRYDIVFLDPAPMADPRPVVMSLRHSANGYYPYMFWLGHEVDREVAISKGMNDCLSKPLETDLLEQRIRNAGHLAHMTDQLTNGKDFGVDGGIMPKAFFQQLYFSSIERANRYGEKSYMLFFKVHTDALDPGTKAEVISGLMDLLNKLRRHSDFMGRTDEGEFCLLVQRPLSEQEPVNAMGRFEAELEAFTQSGAAADYDVPFSTRILTIPVGEMIYENAGAQTARQAES